MLHLHQFLHMVGTGVCGESCSGCSLYLRLNNRYCSATCEELGARTEVGLAPWALLHDRVMGWLHRQAGIPGATPSVRTFRSPTLKVHPTQITAAKTHLWGSLECLYIFNYSVTSEHRFSSQVWFLLGRGWTSSRSLGSRHHVDHKRSCLSPTLLSPLAFGSKTCSPPPTHVCCH